MQYAGGSHSHLLCVHSPLGYVGDLALGRFKTYLLSNAEDAKLAPFPNLTAPETLQRVINRAVESVQIESEREMEKEADREKIGSDVRSYP